MKKIILTVAAIFVAVISFAQVESGFSASIGCGVEPYNYGGDDYNPAMLSGIMVRGDYEFAFANHSGVSAGIRVDYIGLGDRATRSVVTSSGSASVETTWKKAYIDVPVKYNLHFGGFYLNAGPSVRFLLSYKHTDADQTTNETVTYDDLKDDTINKVYFGLGGGIGYAFNGGIKLFVDYDYNFTNVVKQASETLPGTSKPSLISFGIGYNF